MSRRHQLRQDAAQVRGRIDHRAGFVRRRIDHLLCQAKALACSPAALPVAFLCGMLAGHLRVSGIKRAYRLLTRLATQVKGLQIASSLAGSSIR